MNGWVTDSRTRGALVVTALVLWTSLLQQPTAQGKARAEQAGANAVGPVYDADRALRLPADYQQWIAVGQSLGLSYGDAGGGAALFHLVLMEPTAHRHFANTGQFREGTMFALLLQAPESGVLPGRRGEFGGDLRAVEMAVKDSTRVPEGWAYYNFGGARGLRPAAQPLARANCFNCHAEHAARDNVFLQFYPRLAAAAHVTLAPQARPEATARPLAPLALKGLDPVLLTEGQEEMGKAEIVRVHNGRRYQFLSEPTLARFVADPDRFAIQNDTCPVVPGAPVDLGLFVVHDGRIYAFATEDCVVQFRAEPARYLKGSPR